MSEFPSRAHILITGSTIPFCRSQAGQNSMNNLCKCIQTLRRRVANKLFSFTARFLHNLRTENAEGIEIMKRCLGQNRKFFVAKEANKEVKNSWISFTRTVATEKNSQIACTSRTFRVVTFVVD